MNRRPQRAAPALRASVLIAGIAALLGWAAGSPIETWRAMVSAVDASTPSAGSDQLLGSSAALAAWIGVAWLGIAVVLEVASVLPGAVGRGCAAVAAKTSPMLVRRIVQVVIGISVLAGPITAGSAFAAGPSTTTSTSTQVDRPDSLTPALTKPSPASPMVDRPATPFVASPPPAAKRTPTGAVALVTGAAHRDAVDPSHRSADGYVVRRGDTLWDIAARHLRPKASAVDISRAWPAWYDANRAVIGTDPSMIRPGEVLVPPSDSEASTSTAPVGTR
ncbi:MAG TPA: LysM peptidoglycan-binding domain-containing protein [Acidothermaceae bacterium]|nr:LysM peptidoglycan-binding domain-containing protein [Acidothermaceae bacterium]